MSKCETNLYHLYISIPVDYKDGIEKSFRDKSIGSILDDNDPFELIVLEEWITGQILLHIDWDYSKPLTIDTIRKAFEMFTVLGIRPSECKYIEDENY
jgi:hypothetical protein